MVNKENLSDKVTVKQRSGEDEGAGQFKWRERQMQKSLRAWCAWPAEVSLPTDAAGREHQAIGRAG